MSELLVEELSSQSQSIIQSLIDQIPSNFAAQESFLYSGRPWNISYSQYMLLAEESEYAAWLGAFGFVANHFTIYVNALDTFKRLEDLNEFIKSKGYRLNCSGGEVKGGPDFGLAQSSTLAQKVNVEFSDGTYEIPSVYYEFAQRYSKNGEELYSGFVTSSANHIFESTDRH